VVSALRSPVVFILGSPIVCALSAVVCVRSYPHGSLSQVGCVVLPSAPAVCSELFATMIRAHDEKGVCDGQNFCWDTTQRNVVQGV